MFRRACRTADKSPFAKGAYKVGGNRKVMHPLVLLTAMQDAAELR